MPGRYERADIFLNASFIDVAPLSIVEAMRCGMPVVTTAAGSVPWMVTDQVTAVIFSCWRFASFGRAGTPTAWEKELAAKIARQAHEELGSHYWSSVRPKWLEVYSAGRAAT